MVHEVIEALIKISVGIAKALSPEHTRLMDGHTVEEIYHLKMVLIYFLAPVLELVHHIAYHHAGLRVLRERLAMALENAQGFGFA